MQRRRRRKPSWGPKHMRRLSRRIGTSLVSDRRTTKRVEAHGHIGNDRVRDRPLIIYDRRDPRIGRRAGCCVVARGEARLQVYASSHDDSPRHFSRSMWLRAESQSCTSFWTAVLRLRVWCAISLSIPRRHELLQWHLQSGCSCWR